MRLSPHFSIANETINSIMEMTAKNRIAIGLSIAPRKIMMNRMNNVAAVMWKGLGLAI